jgi:hypothetical protein
MNMLRLFRQDRRSTRPFQARRPLVEALEGRQLLSSFPGVADIQGAHIGTNVTAIVGQHLGFSMVSVDQIKGSHIGTSVA